MTMTQGNGSGWRVVSQAQTTDVDMDNRFVEGLRVSFVTGRGHSGSVFVPLAQATPDNVAAVISDRAAVMDEIAGLSSEAG
jgi:hypothetical protein